MHLRSSLGKSLGLGSKIAGWGFAFGVIAITAAGCGGCGADDSAVATCDSAGQNCQICDAYGCHPAEPAPATSSSSSSSTAGAGGGVATTVSSSVGSGGSVGLGGAGGSGASGGSGGAPPCDPSQTACPCGANDTCSEAGTQCIGGLCVPGCNHSFECGAGKVCDNGACVVGCDSLTPCATGYACVKGACQPNAQDPECSDQKPCSAAGDVCVNGLCTTSCKANADCPAGSICDGGSGSCVPDPSPKPGCSSTMPCPAVGQVCESDGYCHYPCVTESSCVTIDARFTHCDSGVCKTDEEVNPQCGLGSACPAGMDCISNQCL